jgi:hypothetical protein
VTKTQRKIQTRTIQETSKFDQTWKTIQLLACFETLNVETFEFDHIWNIQISPIWDNYGPSQPSASSHPIEFASAGRDLQPQASDASPSPGFEPARPLTIPLMLPPTSLQPLLPTSPHCLSALPGPFLASFLYSPWNTTPSVQVSVPAQISPCMSLAHLSLSLHSAAEGRGGPPGEDTAAADPVDGVQSAGPAHAEGL